ncbi:HesB/YadR/YfhF family protein [Lapidilactobacillus wuchangensis]|uniref:HesB/YadR/YfhF family protein n=1 Tax=Lapidilactobacillus wuchangensis TaxID=2486001 RepID=UPI000F76F252|nr:iron-sulfur cluster biosynthesis protein [Lapidilactobacillus wuchangensis]
MKITISPAATAWFKQEFNLTPQQGIHLFGKVYGSTPVHDGFSVGIELAPIPEATLGLSQQNELTFFTTKDDDWFFNGYDLKIDFDEELAEPTYNFLATAN